MYERRAKPLGIRKYVDVEPTLQGQAKCKERYGLDIHFTKLGCRDLCNTVINNRRSVLGLCAQEQAR